MSLVHRHAAGPAALSKLEAESALPRAGLRHHTDHLPVTGLRLLECRLERRHVRIAADEAREAAAARDIEARARGAEPAEHEDVHGLDHAFDAEGAEVVEREVARRQRRRGVAD